MNDGGIGARTVDNLKLCSATQAKVLCYDLHGLHLDLSSRTKYERHERTHQLLRLKAHLNGAATCVPELETHRVDGQHGSRDSKHRRTPGCPDGRNSPRTSPSSSSPLIMLVVPTTSSPNTFTITSRMFLYPVLSMKIRTTPRIEVENSGRKNYNVCIQRCAVRKQKS